MKVPSFDLKEQNQRLRDELMAAIEDVVLSGQFILGDVVAFFETQIAQLCEVKHGIGVGNGSDALYIALVADVYKRQGLEEAIAETKGERGRD